MSRNEQDIRGTPPKAGVARHALASSGRYSKETQNLRSVSA